MRYSELSVLGVYIAPIAPMLILGWVLRIPLRRLADHFGLLRYAWHPALLLLACYIILLSAIVLVAGRVGG